ncbi:restriction endonuclease subunit S [Vibrio splendidus]|uniref:restriction endonuclease subunit S n=1 Tax=Vibrio splendidus TaxID=29497 RepID=UPI001E5D9337|nr:restriction endonuclease subunit S [Vibrio splendidus]MCC4862435.1 restriction endonuclease subunit S [Vibrio splendidus]
MLGNEINRIPDGWMVQHIEDFADINTGSGDTQDREDGGLYPFFVRSNTIERVNNFSFDGEAVLTSGDGVGVGKIYHYVNGKFHYHQRVYNIHNFKPHVCGRYFFEYFRYKFYGRVSRMSAKGSVDSVRMEMIAKMAVLLPSFEEQQKIAEVLSTVGQKIDLIDKQIAETQKLKTGLMQKLFSEGVGVQDEEGNWQPHTEFQESPLGLVPKSWEVSKLGDYALKIGSGVTPKGGSKAYVEKGIPLLRSQNVLFGKFKLDDVAFITDEQHEKMKGSKLQARDVLLNITGASIGRCAVLPSNFEEGNVNQHVCIIRTKDDLEPEFCGIFLNSYLGQKQIWSLQAGGNREGLNFQQIRSFHIPIISQDEQKAIFDICSTVDEKLALLEKQKAETQQLKKGLMQKLLTGEWRVPLDNH